MKSNSPVEYRPSTDIRDLRQNIDRSYPNRLNSLTQIGLLFNLFGINNHFDLNDYATLEDIKYRLDLNKDKPRPTFFGENTLSSISGNSSDGNELSIRALRHLESMYLEELRNYTHIQSPDEQNLLHAISMQKALLKFSQELFENAQITDDVDAVDNYLKNLAIIYPDLENIFKGGRESMLEQLHISENWNELVNASGIHLGTTYRFEPNHFPNQFWHYLSNKVVAAHLAEGQPEKQDEQSPTESANNSFLNLVGMVGYNDALKTRRSQFLPDQETSTPMGVPIALALADLIGAKQGYILPVEGNIGNFVSFTIEELLQLPAHWSMRNETDKIRKIPDLIGIDGFYRVLGKIVQLMPLESLKFMDISDPTSFDLQYLFKKIVKKDSEIEGISNINKESIQEFVTSVFSYIAENRKNKTTAISTNRIEEAAIAITASALDESSLDKYVLSLIKMVKLETYAFPYNDLSEIEDELKIGEYLDIILRKMGLESISNYLNPFVSRGLYRDIIKGYHSVSINPSTFQFMPNDNTTLKQLSDRIKGIKDNEDLNLVWGELVLGTISLANSIIKAIMAKNFEIESLPVILDAAVSAKFINLVKKYEDNQNK